MSEETLSATAEQPVFALVAERLYAPEEIAGPVAVVVERGAIRAIWRGCDASQTRQQLMAEWPGAACEVVDLGAWRLAPGYIDLHTHGSFGYDVTTGDADALCAMAQNLPMSGVTAFYPTIATTGKPETARQVRRVVAVAERQGRDAEAAAEVLGMRLEGPFISHKKKGAQFEPGIRPPDCAEMEELARVGSGWVRMVDFAPEEDDGRFLATLVRLGILPCIGHTAATYEQTIAAIDGGACHSTHLFNAMSPLDHRAPGVPGALLSDTRATVEVIADGIHLHPALLRLAVAARGPQSVALITDAVAAAGLPDGKYEFIGRTVRVADGAVRLPNGTLAGSALTLDRAVRHMVSLAGVAMADAIRMATLTPATIAGVAGRKGAVRPGMDADLIALDAEGYVQQTWIHGRVAYERALAHLAV